MASAPMLGLEDLAVGCFRSWYWASVSSWRDLAGP